MSRPNHELFHAIADPGSAAARKRVVELGLEARVRFRNVIYDEVRHDFDARGGRNLPALWDGETLHEGAEAVIAALESLRS